MIPVILNNAHNKTVLMKVIILYLNLSNNKNKLHLVYFVIKM